MKITVDFNLWVVFVVVWSWFVVPCDCYVVLFVFTNFESHKTNGADLTHYNSFNLGSLQITNVLWFNFGFNRQKFQMNFTSPDLPKICRVFTVFLNKGKKTQCQLFSGYLARVCIIIHTHAISDCLLINDVAANMLSFCHVHSHMPVWECQSKP